MSSGSTPHAAEMALPQVSLASSQDFCAQLTAAQARNFYYGMMLTPQPRRSAMYAIYAWMRAVDDLADAPENEADHETKRRQLEGFRRLTHEVVQDEHAAMGAVAQASPFAAMWPAVSLAFREHQIPLSYLDAMIQGQLLDQVQLRYPDFAALYDYCYKVASVVGLTCIEVWKYEGDATTRKLAEQRGIALQLTNILRDLVEDAQRDRVYLPADELAQFGFDAQSFKQFILDPAAAPSSSEMMKQFDALMNMQIKRARDYYDQTQSLESHLTRCCRPTCWAMMKIYEELLRKMEKRPRVVLEQRVRLSKWRKLWIAGRATLRRGLRG